jgi:alpha-L-rhamnosidase
MIYKIQFPIRHFKHWRPLLIYKNFMMLRLPAAFLFLIITAAFQPSVLFGEDVSPVKKVFMPVRHHMGDTGIMPVQSIDEAAWVWHPDPTGSADSAKVTVPTWKYKGKQEFFQAGWAAPVFLRFKKEFEATGAALVFHVSADERFELFLDGKRIARGPDRSDVEHWSYATYEVKLVPGVHRLEALCWHIGPFAPMAQLSFRGGFILKADGDYDAKLTTGKADWEVARLEGLDMSPPGDGSIFGVGAELTAKGCGPQWKDGAYVKAVTVRAAVKGNPWGESAAGWKLFPSSLPDLIDREIVTGRAVALGTGAFTKITPVLDEQARNPELPQWQALIDGKGEVTVPAGAEVFLLWDLDNYFCAYPVCEVSGGDGAKITWGWAESLYMPGSNAKGNRNEFIGKTFRGMVDTFLPDGGQARRFSTHWWRAGRYCLLTVKTGNTPLTLHRLALAETRYPLENEGRFDGGDPALKGVVDLAIRGLQMTSHETFTDCPFYEQLMYVGDTRLEMLITDVLTADDRLVKRGIELFDFSRRNWGFVNERFPANKPQLSPTYSMIWALMLNDYTLWRNDPAFVKARVIGLRSMLEHFEPYVNRDGLLENLPGWPFMDWVHGWNTGNAPGGKGLSSLNNLLYVYALQKSAEIEDSLGEVQLAARLRAKAERASESIRAKFWDEGRGLVADTADRKNWSEHAQCLALLTDTVSGDSAKRCFDGLLKDPELKRTTIYFSFYLMETWRKFGRGDLIVERLDFWKDLVKDGLKTPVEEPGNTRSDCHAWGSHPLFHLHASVAGVRPGSPGFRTVRIEPQPGRFPMIASRMPHPDGFIVLDLKFEGERCKGSVELPKGITGSFIWKGKELKLVEGKQAVEP